MPDSIIASVCGLTAAVTWGAADFFAAKSSRNISANFTSIYVALISALLYTALFAILPSTDGAWSYSGIAYACGGGLFVGWGLLMFYRGLELGPVSIVSPVAGAYPLVTF